MCTTYVNSLHPPGGKTDMTRYCLTVTCATTRGIVAAIATYLAQNGCNITDNAQFDNTLTGRLQTFHLSPQF
jgi:formyltetrahydrofolate hydrolase